MAAGGLLGGAFWATRALEVVKRNDSPGLLWKRIKLTTTRKNNAKKRLKRLWQVGYLPPLLRSHYGAIRSALWGELMGSSPSLRPIRGSCWFDCCLLNLRLDFPMDLALWGEVRGSCLLGGDDDDEVYTKD